MNAMTAMTIDSTGEFLAFVEDEATAATAREAAQMAGWDAGSVHVGGLRAAHAQLSRGAAPTVLLVDVTGAGDIAEALDTLAHACEPQTRVIAIGTVNDIELYRKLLDMGLTEYLVKPSTPHNVAQALRRAKSTEPLLLQHPVKVSRKVAVVGTRGGAGATGLAVSLGWALAHRHDLSTMLVDLDLRYASMPMALDLETSKGLKELLASPNRIDATLIASVAAVATEKLSVIGAEEDLDGNPSINPEGVEALLKALGQEREAVVVDVPRHLDPAGRAAIGAADTICVVTDLSLVAMRDCKRIMKLLPALNPAAELILVANRVGGVSGEVPREEFERGVEASFQFAVPNDQKAAGAAADQGKAMIAAAAQGAFATEVGRLAARLAGEEADTAPQGPGASLLKRLLRG